MSDDATNKPSNTGMPIVENLSAPDVFASEASFFAVTRDVISITMTSYRLDVTSVPTPTRVVIGRLVMPLEGARAFAANLKSWLDRHDENVASLPKHESLPIIPPSQLN